MWSSNLVVPVLHLLLCLHTRDQGSSLKKRCEYFPLFPIKSLHFENADENLNRTGLEAHKGQIEVISN